MNHRTRFAILRKLTGDPAVAASRADETGLAPTREAPTARALRIAQGLSVALSFALAMETTANEASFKLKPGAGVEVVQRDCAVCHSTDYIQLNSPFADHKMWEAEVTKMINAFGAQVRSEDIAVIVDYLTRNYGALPSAQPHK